MNAFDSNMDHILYNVKTEQFKLDGLLEKFKEVFPPELELVKGMKVHLICMKGKIPKSFKAWSVPYAYSGCASTSTNTFYSNFIITS